MDIILFTIVMVILVVAQTLGKKWLFESRKKASKSGNDSGKGHQNNQESFPPKKTTKLYWKDFHEAEVDRSSQPAAHSEFSMSKPKRTHEISESWNRAVAETDSIMDHFSPEAFSGESRLSEKGGKSLSAMDRIRNLPPMQQAILWSEILTKREDPHMPI